VRFESEDDVEKDKEANKIKSEALPDSNDFQKPAKLDLIVGFLRLLTLWFSTTIGDNAKLYSFSPVLGE